MPKITRKSAATLAGVLVSVACLAYFGAEARQILSHTRISWAGSPMVRALPLAALPYLAAYAALALSWHLLLRSLGQAPSAQTSMGIYFTAQIAKYLPGNVGHHIGRLYLSRVNGLPAASVGMSMVMEVVLVVLAAALLSLPLAPLVIEQLARRHVGWVPFAIAGATLLAAAGVGAYVLRYRVFAPARERLRQALQQARTAGGAGFFLAAAALVVLGMLLAGLSLVLLALSAATSIDLATVSRCVAVFSAAWIAGFLAPGAPAGLGVREAILLAGLSPSIGNAGALEATVLFRGLSVGSDLVAMLLGGWLLRRVGLRATRPRPFPP
jgi:uncharacterized membrane protein YbhN (UPF0104 family)